MPRKPAADSMDSPETPGIVTHNGPNCAITLAQVPIASETGLGTGYQFHCSGIRSEAAMQWLRRELDRQKFPLAYSMGYEEDGTHTVRIEQPSERLKAGLTRAQGVIPEEAEFNRLSDPSAMRRYAVDLCDRAFRQMHKLPACAVIATYSKPNCTIRLEQLALAGDNGRDGMAFQFNCSGLRGEDAANWLRGELRKRKFPLGFSVYENTTGVSVRIERPAEWMKEQLQQVLGAIPNGEEFDRLSSDQAMRRYALELSEMAVSEMQKQEALPKRPLKEVGREILAVHNEVLGIAAYLVPVTYENGQKGQKCSVEFTGKSAGEAADKLVNELRIRRYPFGTAQALSGGVDGMVTVDFPQPQQWMMVDLRKTVKKFGLRDFRRMSTDEGFTDMVKESVAALYSDYIPISGDFEALPKRTGPRR